MTNDDEAKIEKLIDWLNTEINRLAAYHHQKENAAWLAVVFYSGIIGMSLTIAPSLSGDSRSWAIYLIAGIGLILGVFILIQSDARIVTHYDIEKLIEKRKALLEGLHFNEFPEAERRTYLPLKVFEEPGNRLKALYFLSILLVAIGAIIASAVINDLPNQSDKSTIQEILIDRDSSLQLEKSTTTPLDNPAPMLETTPATQTH